MNRFSQKSHDPTGGDVCVSEITDTPERSDERREVNKSVVVRTFEAIASHDFDALDEVMAEGMSFSDPLLEMEGLENYKDLMRGRISALPDTATEIHEILADDDVVVVHFTYRGTHTGEYNGIEPTGNTVEGTAVMIDRLENGKIAQRTEEFDTLSWFRQLGVDPSDI